MAAGFLSPPAALPFSSFLAAASPSFAGAAASPPSTAGAASPSTPSAGVSSAGFSGSLTIVGAAIVATTKSLSVIVGLAFSGSFTEEIFILAPISRLAKSTSIFSGMFSAEQFSSTFLRTIFNTPPLFKPGQSLLFLNITGICKIFFEPYATLIKSICAGLSEITW